MNDRNRRPAVRIPVDAGLDDIVDWKHSLLRNAKGGAPSERLLAAWRREQGYVYLFSRHQIADLIRDIPSGNWKGYEGTLRYFTESDESRGIQWPPVPRKPDGNYDWDCYTPENQEYVCGVNRFAWIVGMAAAARRKGPRFEEYVLAVIDAWIRDNPVPEAVLLGKEPIWRHWYRPWAPFNTAQRIKNWMLAVHLLWDSPALTPARFASTVRSIRQHMVFLARISTKIDKRAAGNHFLTEMECLLYGSLLPWLRETAVMRETAVHNLVRCARRQILPDGVHVERSPGYHSACIQWFAMPFLLCRLNRIALPDDVFRRVFKMLDFNLQMRAPDGAGFKFEDGAAPRGYQSEILLARLTGMTLPVKAPRPGGIIPFIRNIPPLGKVAARPFRLAMYYPDGGFAAARTSWRRPASAVAMKLDGYGGGHSHADFLSFCFAWRGRLVVDERGTLAYDDNEKAVGCKLTAAHNVVRIGDREMLAPGDRKKYFLKRPPIVKVKDVFFDEGKGGRVRTGGRVVWPDGTWWRREIEFLPREGLRIRDTVHAAVAEPVRIQFYLKSEKLRRRGSNGFQTSDRQAAHIQIRCTGAPGPTAGTASVEVYDPGIGAAPASLVTFSASPLKDGEWETTIGGVRG